MKGWQAPDGKAITSAPEPSDAAGSRGRASDEVTADDPVSAQAAPGYATGGNADAPSTRQAAPDYEVAWSRTYPYAKRIQAAPDHKGYWWHRVEDASGWQSWECIPVVDAIEREHARVRAALEGLRAEVDALPGMAIASSTDSQRLEAWVNRPAIRAIIDATLAALDA